MNEIGKKCAQVKRRLNANEPLTGETLAFALELMPDPRGDKADKYDALWAEIARKLKGGEQLSNYEHHLMVDVVLLHVRLQAATAERLESEGSQPSNVS